MTTTLRSLGQSRAGGSTFRISGEPLPLPASVRLLMILRTIAVCGQVAAILVATALGVALPLAPMAAIVALLLALNVWAWIRLTRPPPATYREIAGHLVFDLGAFMALLFVSGGAANPFALLFVLHAMLFGLLLPPLPAVLGVTLVLLGCTVLTRVGVPLNLMDGQPVPPSLMTFGHWLSLTLCAAIVAWFVMRNAAVLREHHGLLVAAAQKARDDATITRLGVLAAGAAHELSTPLTTMAVVAGGIGRDAKSPSLRRDADILVSQVEACRQTLSNLLAAAGHARAEGGRRQRLDAFLGDAASRFRTTRPDATLAFQCDGQQPPPDVYAEQALRQAIVVLLDNAADVSPQQVELTASWDSDALRITVDDRGVGIPPAKQDALGRVVFTTKPSGKGRGLGLVLAAHAVNMLEGTLHWEARRGGGTRARILLPLRVLRLPESP